mmetsp:Transcript_14007/g.41013  ORF Transcript_14007/g.41013 Transcript_14007/m.41013 type:complete len:443 (-) Transcript_14007:125-1453(-)
MGRIIINVASAAIVAAAALSSLSATAAQGVGGGDASASASASDHPELLVTDTSGPTECDPSDRVSENKFLIVHYTSTVQSAGDEDDDDDDIAVGRIFASTHLVHGSPVGFRMGAGSMTAGYERGLLGLCSGSKATLIVPPDLAYGDEGLSPSVGPEGEEVGGVPPGATVRYEVEILSVTDEPPDYDGEEGGEEPNLFVEFDADGDGKLNGEEVDSLFQSLGMMGGAPFELWENEDVDKDGFISWDEFGGPKGALPPWADGGNAEKDNVVEEVEEVTRAREEFDAIDSDKGGRLSLEELTKYFAAEDIEDDPSAIMDDLDSDKDGYVTPEEFGLSPPLSEQFGEEEDDMEMNPLNLFKDLDEDGDGRLDRKEMEKLFSGLGAMPEEYWDDEDFNKDGYITLDEFLGGGAVDGEFGEMDAAGVEELLGDLKEGTEQAAAETDEL